MGRRDKGEDDIENIAPSYGRVNSVKSKNTVSTMKTRSNKSQTKTAVVKNTKLGALTTQDPSSHEALPSIEVELSGSSSTSARSPLLESSRNDLTPEKIETETGDTLANHIESTEATPTTNLKILCDAVDHDESISETSGGATLKTDPVTPTSNLKMLINAASPEIRSLELSKSRLFTDDEEEFEEDLDTSTRKVSKSSAATRKQKSLGILCRRFMAQFDESPPQTSRIEVCLDELAAHLGTERRRIYDIVNVLESVEMMSRRAKNRYLWHGKTNLSATLVKLKHFAESEKVAKQLELVRELELARLYGRKSNNGFLQSGSEAVVDHPKYKEYMELFGESYKKERSLGVMSQKFLMLFLTSKTKTINLDMAAKILLGDPLVETKQTNSQFKTKIRRLYDIANILASINLICKVHVNELRGRKPAFSYIGPDVEKLSSLDEYKYLKDVEVTRPGRTTLDMKMEELKKKMEAHLAAELAADTVKQVPPVTVQAPDMEEIKQSMASGSSASLLQAATEHAAAKRDRAIKPKSNKQPIMVIQGLPTTSAAGPLVVDFSQHSIVSSSHQDQMPGISLLPIVQTVEGNKIYMTTQPLPQSPVLHTAGAASTRRILPQLATRQTLTLYTPPAKPAASLEPSTQQKRTSSQIGDTQEHAASTSVAATTSNAVTQTADGTFSTFFLTKADNEYFLIHKKPKLDADCQAAGETSRTVCQTEKPLNEEMTTTNESVTQQVLEVHHTPVSTQVTPISTQITPISTQVTPIFTHVTPISSEVSPVPVPIVFSTPSSQHVLQSSLGTDAITGTPITFLASPTTAEVVTPGSILVSPVSTPAERQVEKTVTSGSSAQAISTVKLK